MGVEVPNMGHMYIYIHSIFIIHIYITSHLIGMESASYCYSSQIRHDSILSYFRGDLPLSAATYLKEHDVLHHEMETQIPHFRQTEDLYLI